MVVDLINSDIFKNEQQRARLQAEAEFGMREIAPFFADDQKPISVLEVGCGTGLLLTQIAQEFEDVFFTGVEPIGPGFTQFKSALDAIETKYENITFIREPIEEIESIVKYDLIYSVNVFEHLDDWRLAIDKCVSMLNPSGRLVILCPNYWIPYESHFALPVFWNKGLTYKIFSKKIKQLEEKMKSEGLWSSLNFIKVPQIQQYCKTKNYNLNFDTGMMARMLDRLVEDPEFRKRQSGLATVAILANRLGAGTVLRIFPACFSAYTKAIIQV